MTTAFLNAVGTAVPAHEVHGAFVTWAEGQPSDPRRAALFRRMAERSGIERRWSVLPPAPCGGSPIRPGGFYEDGTMPPTSARMAFYAEAAPELALRAVAALDRPVDDVTHLVVASCTGFTAPGLDQIVAARLGLPGTVERTLIGFMGCYAAVCALRTARHIVRSEPDARVLVLTVELTTLHLQATDDLESLLAQLQFGDGAAAALVTADAQGLALDRLFSTTLPGSAELIRWAIGDQGFAMHLSGEVPKRIGEALRDPALVARITGGMPADTWAVHAGGRSILDAVERALDLSGDALDESRRVLAENGNMSSATLMFVLKRILAGPPVANGVAVAFGPGLAAEGFSFRSAA